jgi:hypothetical protein
MVGMKPGSSKVPIDVILELCKLYKITPNDILDFSSELPATEISKIYKLYKLITEEQLDVDELIDYIKSSKQLFS